MDYISNVICNKLFSSKPSPLRIFWLCGASPSKAQQWHLYCPSQWVERYCIQGTAYECGERHVSVPWLGFYRAGTSNVRSFSGLLSTAFLGLVQARVSGGRLGISKALGHTRTSPMQTRHLAGSNGVPFCKMQCGSFQLFSGAAARLSAVCEGTCSAVVFCSNVSMLQQTVKGGYIYIYIYKPRKVCDLTVPLYFTY